MGAYIDRVKRHFSFSPAELQGLAIVCLVAAFVFAFDDGQPEFNLTHWLTNFLGVLILVAIVFFLH